MTTTNRACGLRADVNVWRETRALGRGRCGVSLDVSLTVSVCKCEYAVLNG
jgi:hypothetical protein